MEQEDAQHGITIYTPHGVGLSFCQSQQTKNKQKIHNEHTGRTDETLLLTNCAEDEVGVLLWYILQLRLRAFQEALALQTTRTNGYLCLIDVITSTCGIFLRAKQHLDTDALMGLHDVVDKVVATKVKGCGKDTEQTYPHVVEQTLIESQEDEEDKTKRQTDDLNDANVERDDKSREKKCQTRRNQSHYRHDGDGLFVGAI